jgi:hypothetical protein
MLIKTDKVLLHFSTEFMLWAIAVSMNTDYDMQFYCCGWEM